MKTRLIITDVTRMQEGRVCIAGYDPNCECVRPVLPPPGIHERSLYARGSPIIFPFALVEFDLQRRISEPPHTEDWRYDPTSVRLIGRLEEKRRRALLDQTLSSDIKTIFQTPIFSDFGYYVMAGQGSRSLGTVQPKQLIKSSYDQTKGKWKYRLGFVDHSETAYWLTVTDLTWRYFCDSQREAGKTPGNISSELTAKLKSTDVYLRIGLARGWKEHPDRCFVQITSVYTFPDYLAGLSFADFSPKRK